MTAHEIACVINRIAGEATIAGLEISEFLLPDGAIAIDDHTLLVRARQGHAMLPGLLSSANPFDHPLIQGRLNGSGPMKVQWIDPDRSLTIFCHERAWRRARLPDQLHLIFFPDFASQARAVAAGEIDTIGHFG